MKKSTTDKRPSLYHEQMAEKRSKGAMKVIDETRRIMIQFEDPEGEKVEQKFDLNLGTTHDELQELLNTILENKEKGEYSFFHKNVEIRKS